MPKAEKGSLKDIGKRIKMKGLQKLKFYCQICEKQCRDANGFKCHLTSENHLQQMKVFSTQATKMMDQYSKTFEKNFLATLRMRHSTSKVAANTVYQEMIQDKQHTHMNATIWTTLSDFVKYLGKTGQCVVEETDRGWYITYIERDLAKLIQVEQTQRRIDAELAAEIEYQQRMEQQRVAAATSATSNLNAVTAPTKLNISEESASAPTLQLSLRTNKKTKKASTSSVVTTSATLKNSVFDDDDDDDDDENDDEDDDEVADSDIHNIDMSTRIQPLTSTKHQRDPTAVSTSKTATPTTGAEVANDQPKDGPATGGMLNSTMTGMPRKGSTNVGLATGTNGSSNNHTITSTNDDPPWIRSNIMVRIINQTLAEGKYYRQKGYIRQVDPKDPYVAQVHVQLDDDHHKNPKVVILQLDQDDLETIGPKRQNDSVCMVRGPYVGWYGTIISFDKKKYSATIELTRRNDGDERNDVPSRPTKSIMIENVDYDDFSKLYEP